MSSAWDLVADLERVARESPERRASTVRRVTDLFLCGADALTEQQIELFDVVIARLATAIEARARAELSERLADVPRAPRAVIRFLAHDEIVIARPVLSRSPRLSDEDLIAVVLAKGRDHMLAISERSRLNEPVTDVLVTRGDRVVVHAVAANPGAHFSPATVTALVDRARADEALQALLSRREDLPEVHLSQLVVMAAEAARRRLAQSMPEVARPALDAAVQQSASSIEAIVSGGGRDYCAAYQKLRPVIEARRLVEDDLVALTATGRLDETICAVAHIAGLAIPTAERLFDGGESDLLLVIGRCHGWSWSTVQTLLRLRQPSGVSGEGMRRLEQHYERLSPAAAQRVLHFLKVREASPAGRRQPRSNVR
jgi:uncharacterized protein (DUF2336 family)